ncbi:TfoX/Sxy family protein [Novosphingobium sp. RD2P27]|uniref:TfoX/Sxy family protein n=1 Tax=Novosphingobium kalidii TaxID=3230299 RepID=A0ABV2CZD4_9SPHN
MATQERTVEFIIGQLAGVSGILAGKMFGEYGIWCDGKIVALICDDQLFVKPTAPGRELAGGVAEVSPYPGAKPSLLIDPDRWDDADWLVALIRATADALPAPKPKRSKPKTA